MDIKAKLEDGFVDYEFSLPPQTTMGILTTNSAFKVAKLKQISPIEQAQSIAGELQNYCTVHSLPLEVTTTGPYVNIDINADFITNELTKKTVSIELPTEDNSIILEYFQLNAAKMPHVGHIRTGNIGESLRRILMLKYPRVIIDRHLGDWGVQFGLVVWGIINGYDYGLTQVDFDNPDSKQIIESLEKLYVEVNKLTADQPEIRKQAQKLCHNLESSFHEESEHIKLWEKIVKASLLGVESVARDLNLNQNGFWSEVAQTRRGSELLWPDKVQSVIQNKRGVWEHNQIHKEYHHNIDFGESFLYGYFHDEIDVWEQAGIVTKERDGEHYKYFIDLDAEKLGRVHLISSDGYTTYMFRDVITRFVWGGFFGADYMLSCIDSRQSHSLNQAFAVIDRILQNGLYQQRVFPLLTREQTDTAVSKLKARKPIHIPNGYLLLTTGAMSSRKGNVFHFETLIEQLSKAVTETLNQKNYAEISEDKIKTIAVASLKWADLNRDRQQDVVFDVSEVTKFEGNTGVYQLYTYARLSNILKKSQETQKLPGSSDFYLDTLNESELLLIRKTIRLPYILQQVAGSYKPHILAQFLFELSTEINSWYGANTVINESDPRRRTSLLILVKYLKEHLKIGLNLLGIETLEEM